MKEEFEPPGRPLEWLGSTREDIRDMPASVRQDIGYALFLAECGGKSPHAKPMKGFGGGVLEVVENDDGDTYRAVYTVRFKEAVYVLHVFQKKSKRGIATAQSDVNLIRRRLKLAQEMHDDHEKEISGN